MQNGMIMTGMTYQFYYKYFYTYPASVRNGRHIKNKYTSDEDKWNIFEDLFCAKVVSKG